MAARAPVLSARGVSVRGTSRSNHGAVLDDASIELFAGEIATLTGASGSGKSTMLRVLALLTEPDGARIELRGADANGIAPEVYRRRVGFVAQTPAMLDGTVADNLKRGPLLANAPIDDAAVASLLDRVGLPAAFAARVARETSGGERVRVALARALSLDPEVLLLDEPTAALDRAAADRILDLVKALAADGRSVLVVTHAPADVERLGGAAWACVDGRIVRAEETAAP